MHFSSFVALAFYIAILVIISYRSYRHHQTEQDFIIGGRKMNFWVTALAAHASDMTSWVFMGYPGAVYASGLFNAWLAVGLVLCMFLNWQFIAPKLRQATEQYNSLTLSSFFESRYQDTSGILRIGTTLVSFLFYTIYISAGLSGLGILIQTLFGLKYIWALSIGTIFVIPYLFSAGYVTLAWTDAFQGIFLLLVIIFVPLYTTGHMGGLSSLKDTIQNLPPSHSFFPETGLLGWIIILLSIFSWGPGYFGQPHIVTKFMGIRHVEELPKSKWVGISWQTLSLIASTSIGLVALAFYHNAKLDNPELIFIRMTTSLFFPLLAAFILSAILGVTITATNGQILVLSSLLAEDFYKKTLKKKASSREILLVSRLSIIFVALVSYLIALMTKETLFGLVYFAWAGLGASFGPLVIFGLYSKRANRFGAVGGLITGALFTIIWPLINKHLPINIPGLIPSFCISLFTIWSISSITQFKNDKGIMEYNE